jgi:ribonuclease J
VRNNQNHKDDKSKKRRVFAHATSKNKHAKPLPLIVAHESEKLEKTGKSEKENKTNQTSKQSSIIQNASEKQVLKLAGNQGNSNNQNSSANTQASHSSGKNKEKRKTPLKIIPLGGMNEIGKNLTVFECSNDLFVVDCGLAFPDAELPGVDIVIPDFSYLEKNRQKLRGVILTHGHEDHIGGLAYMLKKINVPVYGTAFTLGLVAGKLKEHGLHGRVQLNIVKARQTIRLGCMAVEFINVNHSIPDAVGLAIHTPAGVVVHTGDFKVDFTPINGDVIDLARFGELGAKGVLCLMSDSTNAEREGYTQTERTVGDSFERLFESAEGRRILVASFASNVHRAQQVIDCAAKYGRKVALFGRSMVNILSTALELGYLTIPKNVLIDIDEMDKYKSEEIVLITTGSQGEPMSALTRMAMNDHKRISITSNDFIIISATPIPGNEKYVTKVVNELLKSGAEVVYEKMYDVHVSGHACKEELKLLFALTKPRFFIPVHGEYKHLIRHAQIAKEMGVSAKNIVIPEIGNVIETDGCDIKVVSQVPAGRTLVDGLGVGDVGSTVLRDRKHLATDGLIVAVLRINRTLNKVVGNPDIISRGFVYVKESEDLITEAKQIIQHAIKDVPLKDYREWNGIKMQIRDVLSDYIYTQTKRSPMILPIVIEQ